MVFKKSFMRFIGRSKDGEEGTKMFAREDRRQDFDINGFIGKGMKVEGKLSFDKTVRIDGSFKGEINATGTLVVGEGAFVEADIKVGTLIINGEVRGTVEATGRVELQAPAKLVGELRAPNLIIGEGTIFEGNCVMLKSTGAETTYTDVYRQEEEIQETH
ncbi:MAG TPA: polymer-forming cytoskeletal protein [Thermodesulfobacteriota bacterium]|nr:polymer-forming cytoskeletal protein [Thermodesulfobacteriota bacterium]